MAGELFVVDAGKEFRIRSRIAMGGKGCRAAVAVAGGRIFIRTDSTLYCVGNRD
jgi:hypothetical protein